VHSHAQLARARGLEVRRPPAAHPLNIAFHASEDASSARRALGRMEGARRLLTSTGKDHTQGAEASATIASIVDGRQIGAPGGVRGGLAPWQLRKIDRYVRENLGRSVRMQALAEQINLSLSHFGRSFKASCGLAPRLYILKLRLELAQSLMLTTDDPLCCIAVTCGLTDQSHLTNLFRRHVGETPAAWRRRRLKEDGAGVTRSRNVRDHFAGSVPAFN